MGALAPNQSGPLPPTFASLESLYVDRRPPVGTVHVVDIGTADFDNQVLAESLAGLVNRNQAQVYLLQGVSSDSDRIAEQFWLNQYQQEGLVSVSGTESLSQALSDFGSMPSGYIEYDDSESWTVNAATTLASIDNALIVSPETLPQVQALGLPLIEDLRGKWTSAAQCYGQLQQQYSSQMASKDIAMLFTNDSHLRDFLIQQGIFTMYAHPEGSDWQQELTILKAFPPGIVVYGYLAQDGYDEFLSTLELSKEGKMLVPSDLERNLSFHLAVAGNQPVQPALEPANPTPCVPGQVNVMPVITDGDNLGVDSLVWERPGEWGAARRGAIPLGWSISPILSILSPGIWDYYMTSRSPNDEFVAMMGDGYAFPSQMPDGGAAFYSQSFQLMSYLGLRSYWSLDLALVTAPSGGGMNPAWSQLDGGASNWVPGSILASYFAVSSFPQQTASPSGVPTWQPNSPDDYLDTPAQLAGILQALVPPATPSVSLLSVPIWNFSIDDLVSALAPLQSSTLRYVTPSQAAACVSGGLPVVGMAAVPGGGYRLVSSGGVGYIYGSAVNEGGPVAGQLRAPVVGTASTPDGLGYWDVAADGGVFTFGDAGFYGAAASFGNLAAPVVGMVPTTDGRGYWQVAADGGVFSYGDATFYGSLPSSTFACTVIGCDAGPVVAMAPTADGKGYWLVSRNGRIFSYGDAAVFGCSYCSTGRAVDPRVDERSGGPAHSLPAPTPVVSAAGTPDGKGLWTVSAAGSVNCYGDALCAGQPGGFLVLAQPVVGFSPTADGKGYWLTAADGGVFAYGDATYAGSVPGGACPSSASDCPHGR